MSVRFFLPDPLRLLAGGRSELDIATEARTLQGALEALFQVYPGLRDRILTEQGEIRMHVNLFVGNVDVRLTGGFTTPVPRGAEISIIPAISGG